MADLTFDVRTPTFARILEGRLPFHVCVDNWGIGAGERVCFREVHGATGPTGRTLCKTVTWVYVGEGLEEGYIVLGFGPNTGPWIDPTTGKIGDGS